ncbi:hypothetical protein Pmani_029862 [Petrolisthes manimaculis]|uniref:Uncharacterized protein n=1 Tax=Petrolisthes manimaculis TaxID=1843537 RepID=A0AAE1NWU6_9EUCA|nr:hypothetical protein Pmani_029862 [Petrolisthes manimaculis]
MGRIGERRNGGMGRIGEWGKTGKGRIGGDKAGKGRIGGDKAGKDRGGQGRGGAALILPYSCLNSHPNPPYLTPAITPPPLPGNPYPLSTPYSSPSLATPTPCPVTIHTPLLALPGNPNPLSYLTIHTPLLTLPGYPNTTSLLTLPIPYTLSTSCTLFTSIVHLCSIVI